MSLFLTIHLFVSFKLAVERLEAALEKAAERNAAAQSVIDRQEAELSKAHIRRNLELMDKRIPSALHVLAEEKMPVCRILYCSYRSWVFV